MILQEEIKKAVDDIIGQMSKAPDNLFWLKADGTYAKVEVPLYAVSDHFPRFIYERFRGMTNLILEEIKNKFFAPSFYARQEPQPQEENPNG